MKWHEKIGILVILVAVATGVGCGADDPASNNGSAEGGFNNGGTNNGVNNGGTNNGGRNNGGFIPEEEEEFEFSRPAVVGDRVFVANETLNAVAVIEANSLRIQTVAVGFRPTRVVGPTLDVDAQSVMVLNEGSSSVTLIDPETLETSTVEVMRRANAIAADPTGSHAVVWFDAEEIQPGQPTGDLSAVTVVTGGASHEVAVGFHVRRVQFTRDGTKALVLTDDGLSVIDLEALDSDVLSPPIAVLPPGIQNDTVLDDEVLVGPDGRYTVTRTTDFAGVVLLDVEANEIYSVPLVETPTDLDWVDTDPPKVLITLRNAGQVAVATVPDGLIAASETFVAPPVPPQSADMGTADVGTDMGVADTGSDSGSADVGELFPPVEGFEFIDLIFGALGVAEIAEDGTTALLFSTIGSLERAVLLNLVGLEQRGLSFEKGVRGAASDRAGETFVVFHTREEGPLPPDVTPSDPEFIARQWGLSVVDVKTATSRLILTEQNPQRTALWPGDGNDPKLYVTFEAPALPAGEQPNLPPSFRDLLWVNLRTFRQDTLRLPGLPEGLGPIRASGKIFVSQRHPQGRLTFIDVVTGNWQTVTGYQLNAGID